MHKHMTQAQIEMLGNHIIAAEEGNAQSIRFVNGVTRAFRRAGAVERKKADKAEAQAKFDKLCRARGITPRKL